MTHMLPTTIETDRPLDALESGFAAGDDEAMPTAIESDESMARVRCAAGVSAIHELAGGRTPAVQPLPANASLMHPYAATPVLRGRLEPGVHQLACAVYASDDPAHPAATQIPPLPRT